MIKKAKELFKRNCTSEKTTVLQVKRLHLYVGKYYAKKHRILVTSDYKTDNKYHVDYLYEEHMLRYFSDIILPI